MEKQKITTPRREKMLKIISKAARQHTLVGGEFFINNIENSLSYDDSDTSLVPKGGCKSAGRCAMAELFYAAGYSNKRLAAMGGTETGWSHKDYKTLWDHYRIDAKDADKIIQANDDGVGCSTEAFEKRQSRVAKVINSLKDRVRVNPYRFYVKYGEKEGLIPTKEEAKILSRFGLLGEYKDRVSNGEYV